MSIVLTDSANYTAIADAIRAKGGSGTFTPAQMAQAIANLPSGGDVTGETYTYTSNASVFTDYQRAEALSEWPASEIEQYFEFITSATESE